MILKTLILLVAVCYVHSTPISIETIEKAPIVDGLVSGTEQSAPSTVQTVSSSIQSVSPAHAQPAATVVASPAATETEKKLLRTARNDKVEYIYVTPDGEILPNQKAYHHAAKNLLRDFIASDKTEHHQSEKVVPAPKEALSSRSAESVISESKPSDEANSSTGDLHYAGSIKVRTEKNRNGLVQSTPLIASQPIAGPPFYYPNDLPLISSPSFSYPLSYPLLSRPTVTPVASPVVTPVASPVVAPLVAPVAPVVTPVVSHVVQPTAVAPVVPEEIEIRRRPYSQIGAFDFIPPLFNDFLENRFLPIGPYILGRQLQGLLSPASWLSSSPNYQNPFLSYLWPQQTPNINYLVGRSVSPISGGLNGYYPSTSSLYPSSLYPTTSSLYPSASSLYPSTLYPQNYPYLAYPQYPAIYPQYSAAYPPQYPAAYPPQFANQYAPIPSASILSPAPIAPTDFVTRRTVEPVTTETVTTVTSNVQPFSDSTTIQPNSAVASSVLIPGITEGDSVIEKPLLYSSQSAELRSPYSASYSGYSGAYGNYLNGAYPGRIIDPTTGLPTSNYLSAYNRYPASSGYYSRYNYPYTGAYSGAYSSSYYRPGLVAPIGSTYPIYGPYNGVGYVSPMHYSADTSSLVNRKSEDAKSDTAVPAKEQPVVGKEGNLVYSVRTSKSESKETVSRLKQGIDSNKIREDDKKA